MSHVEATQAGRPTICTPEAIKTYCSWVRRGLTLAASAAKAGIHSYATIQNWRTEGEKGREPYATFLAAEKNALAEWENDRLQAMDAAGQLWVREAWKLERRLPAEYSLKQRHEVTGDNGGPLQIEQSGRLELTGDAALAVLAFHENTEPEVDELHSAPADAEAGSLPESEQP